jgi:hypothetical protein
MHSGTIRSKQLDIIFFLLHLMIFLRKEKICGQMGKIGPCICRILRFFLQKLIYLVFSTKNWKMIKFHHIETLFVCIVSYLKHLFRMKEGNESEILRTDSVSTAKTVLKTLAKNSKNGKNPLLQTNILKLLHFPHLASNYFFLLKKVIR